MRFQAVWMIATREVGDEAVPVAVSVVTRNSAGTAKIVAGLWAGLVGYLAGHIRNPLVGRVLSATCRSRGP